MIEEAMCHQSLPNEGLWSWLCLSSECALIRIKTLIVIKLTEERESSLLIQLSLFTPSISTVIYLFCKWQLKLNQNRNLGIIFKGLVTIETVSGRDLGGAWGRPASCMRAHMEV